RFRVFQQTVNAESPADCKDSFSVRRRSSSAMTGRAAAVCRRLLILERGTTGTRMLMCEVSNSFDTKKTLKWVIVNSSGDDIVLGQSGEPWSFTLKFAFVHFNSEVS